MYIALTMGSVCGLCVGFVLNRIIAQRNLQRLEEQSQLLLQEREQYFETQKHNALLEYRDELYRKKIELEQSFDEERKSLQEDSKKLAQTS